MFQEEEKGCSIVLDNLALVFIFKNLKWFLHQNYSLCFLG